MRSLTRSPVLALLALSLAICGCGSAQKSSGGSASAGSGAQKPASSRDAAIKSEEPAGTGSGAEVVASVASIKITKAALLHRMSIGPTNKNEVPLPPDYGACVEHLRAGKPSAGSEAQLKSSCAQTYQKLLKSSLSGLINDAWLISEAERDGIPVDRAALARELQAAQAVFAQQGGRAKTLARSGRTLSDLKREMSVGQLSNKLYKRIEARIAPVSSALVARYYAAHKQSFTQPVRRDLHIVRAASAAAALHAKRQIRSGESFAQVVGQLSVAQPFGAHNGLVRGLTHTLYAEPELADAIFKAPLHVLSGPVKIPLGYYVFEVLRVIPAHQLTLAQAAPSIRQSLPQVLHDKTLAAGIAAFRGRWRAQTDCKAGYVVEACRQYSGHGPKGELALDPYVL